MNNFKIKEMSIFPYMIVSLALFVLLILPDLFHPNIAIYAPAEINFFDESLYPSNLDVVGFHQSISPRIGSLCITYLLLLFGFTYEQAYLFLSFFVCVLFSFLSTHFVVKAGINNKWLATILLPVFFYFARLGNIAGFYIFGTRALYMGVGTAFISLAIIIALYNKKKLSWAFFLVVPAALCHIHEGIWGLFFLFIIGILRESFGIFKKKGLYIAILSILILTIPNLLTSHAILSPSDFYTIYVQEHIPHHLSLPTIGVEIVVLMFASYLSVFVISLPYLSKEWAKLLSILIAVYVAIILLWYVSHEVIVIPFLIKIYLCKSIKYITFIFTLVFIKTIDQKLTEGAKWFIAAFAAILFVPFSIWLLLFVISVVVYNSKLDEKYKNAIFCIFVFIGIVMAYKTPITPVTHHNHKLILLWTILAVSLCFIRYKTILAVSMVSLMACYGFYKYSFFKTISNPEMVIENIVGTDNYMFAKNMSSFIPKSESFLCSPNDGMMRYVQHISRRSAYTLWTTVPSSEETISIWNKRNKQTFNIENWTPSEIALFMQKESINYIVLKHNVVIEQSGLFEKLEDSNNYCLFRKSK